MATKFKKVHEEKQIFVETLLLPVLKGANPHVKNCEYYTDEYGEMVIVIMENNAKYKIDVTGDSLSAIVLDVFKVMTYK